MTHSNMLQILSNFMEMMSNNSIMCLIPKLKEIKSKEHGINFLMYFLKITLTCIVDDKSVNFVPKYTNPSKLFTCNST